jgi:hypothetical protein
LLRANCITIEKVEKTTLWCGNSLSIYPPLAGSVIKAVPAHVEYWSLLNFELIGDHHSADLHACTALFGAIFVVVALFTYWECYAERWQVPGIEDGSSGTAEDKRQAAERAVLHYVNSGW